MSVIATVSVPAEDFPLAASVLDDGDAVVEMDRVVPLGETVQPYIWVQNADGSDVATALERDRGILSATVVDSVDDGVLCRTVCDAPIDGFLTAILDVDATILDATATDDCWRIRFQFDDGDQFTEFYRRCGDLGIDVDVPESHAGLTTRTTIDLELTDTQRETLRIAYEQGYFDVPRQCNLVDLAAELDISDTATSQRLRRGIDTLVSMALDTPESDE
jgi:predicted DNA binding protein